MKCRGLEEFRCAVEDQIGQVLARLPRFEVVVLATPVYFMGFSAQLKLLIDRMFCLFKINEDGSITSALKDQVIALIATAGGEREHGLGLTEDNARIIAGFMGLELQSLLVPSAPSEPGELAGNQELREEALTFGAALAA
jgi:multimeric flavodoxin WrbA